VIALALNFLVLAGLLILLTASIAALREGLRQRARLRGIVLTVGLAVLSLLGLWAVLI
jgi:hypothetical protein